MYFINFLTYTIKFFVIHLCILFNSNSIVLCYGLLFDDVDSIVCLDSLLLVSRLMIILDSVLLGCRAIQCELFCFKLLL
jgi:hypothetical protein